tara:strand:- start:279 stop:611 length:333 start_codon:yes stop_codon:yes gene_type:complete
MLSSSEIVQINKFFDKGKLVNKSSLEFAVSSVNKSKDWITQLAYLLRSIIVDHIFEDGNKRTGAAIFVAYCRVHKKAYDIYKIDLVIRDLIQKNRTDIKIIRRMIKNAII